MNLTGVMYGKIILAVAVALCLTSIIRLMGMRKDKSRPLGRLYRVDKPSHSVSVLRFGAHPCQIRSDARPS